MSADRPLTSAEFARLLRAFAHLIESAAAQDEPAPTPRRARRTKRGATAPLDDVAVARLNKNLRRIGVVP